MIYEVSVGPSRLRVDLAPDGRFLIDEKVVAADVRELVRGRQWSVDIDGRVHEVTVVLHSPLRLAIDGIEIGARAVDERALASTGADRQTGSGRRELRAPMSGLLKAVHVSEGDVIEAGRPLVTLEAMKMENELVAPARGRVLRLAASAGSTVEGGAVLAVLEDVAD